MHVITPHNIQFSLSSDHPLEHYRIFSTDQTRSITTKRVGMQSDATSTRLLANYSCE